MYYEFTVSGMRLHTWCCDSRDGTHRFYTHLHGMCEQVQKRWYTRVSPLTWEMFRFPSREYVRRITYYDALLYTNTNTYLVLYGHRHEDSFVSWKCTIGAVRTALELLLLLLYLPGSAWKIAVCRETWKKGLFLLKKKKDNITKNHYIYYIYNFKI